MKSTTQNAVETSTSDMVSFIQKIARLTMLQDKFNALPEAERPARVGDMIVDADEAFDGFQTLDVLIEEARNLLKTER